MLLLVCFLSASKHSISEKKIVTQRIQILSSSDGNNNETRQTSTYRPRTYFTRVTHPKGKEADLVNCVLALHHEVALCKYETDLLEKSNTGLKADINRTNVEYSALTKAFHEALPSYMQSDDDLRAMNSSLELINAHQAATISALEKKLEKESAKLRAKGARR